MKKMIVISDSFKGTLSSLEICEIAKQSVPRFFPDCQVSVIPAADGGEGTVECFIQAIHARPVAASVTGPCGEPIQAVYCRLGNQAIIEMASAAGLPMAGGRKNVGEMTTFGVGSLIRHAVEHGCTKILLWLGGSCTNDGGCGCAAALGVTFRKTDGTVFVPVGNNLDQIAEIDCMGAKKLLQGIQITGMCDVDNPLYGPRGAAHIFGPQKGADEVEVERLDANLRALDQVIRRELGLDLSQTPGAGAAGGMGAGCIAFMNADLKPGIEAVLDLVNFDRQLDGAGLVITGEGRIDGQSVHGKVISGVAKRTKPRRIPLVAIAGGIADGAEEAYDLGVTAMFGTDRQATAFEEAATRSHENYQRTLEDILRLIQALERDSLPAGIKKMPD